MKINALGSFRYSITGLANAKAPPAFPMQVSLTVTMSATYAQLIRKHIDRILLDTKADSREQIARNHMTAIRAFMKHTGKTETSPIGAEMGSDYADVVKHYLAIADIGDRSRSDRRSLLNAWLTTFEMMGTAPEPTVRGRERQRADIPSNTPTPFEKALMTALREAGLTPKRAARMAGISTSAVGRWSRGALPNLRSSASLGQLESVLNIPAGRLEELLKESLGKLSPVHRNSYRDRHKSRCADTYHLKLNELNESFLAEWNALLTHKCAIRTTEKQRHSGGRWSETGDTESVGATPNLSILNNKHFASASVLWKHVGAFLGFLQRPVSQAGWGIDPASIQTLAWLSVPEAIEDFLVFLTERSDGLRHTGHAVFCSSVAALTHSTHGYLTQSPNLLSKLPSNAVHGRSWLELCNSARSTATEWKSVCTDISRDPKVAIQFLLDQPAPLEPIMTAMQKLRTIGNDAPANSKEEALARRNELLLGLLLSNPLRRKNLIDLTIRDDNTGNVYKSASGEWRIRLPRSAFKNGKRPGKGSSKQRPYDVGIAPWLNSLMTDYIQYFRPVLAGENKIDRLLISGRGTPLNGMTARVLSLTRVLIPGSGGFGPHAFRHLVATDWLRRNPNDFLTVAELLNDTLDVVINTYSHLKQDDALNRHSSQLNKMLPSYLRAPE